MRNKSIVLFRFHKNLDLCKKRIEILNYYNPDKEIHGLYGGNVSEFESYRSGLKDQLKTIKYTDSNDSEWKWLHPDISLKRWFIEFGNKLSFDYLYDYEWDILALDNLDLIYPRINQETIALSSLTPMRKVKETWDWTSQDPHADKYEKFKKYLFGEYNIKVQQYASLGPGPYLTRKFLEEFSKTQDVDLVISEISYPAIAEGLGFNIIDTGIMPDWDDEENENKYFNCNDVEIKKEVIKEELIKESGRRIFHPIKTNITLQDIFRYKGES